MCRFFFTPVHFSYTSGWGSNWRKSLLFLDLRFFLSYGTACVCLVGMERNAHRAVRLARGSYTYRGASIERLGEDHAGLGAGWFVTYPGAYRADDVYETLRDAKAAVDLWHDTDA